MTDLLNGNNAYSTRPPVRGVAPGSFGYTLQYSQPCCCEPKLPLLGQQRPVYLANT